MSDSKGVAARQARFVFVYDDGGRAAVTADRAAQVAIAIAQIIRTTHYLHEIQRQVEDLLRDEFADIARNTRDETRLSGE